MLVSLVPSVDSHLLQPLPIRDTLWSSTRHVPFNIRDPEHPELEMDVDNVDLGQRDGPRVNGPTAIKLRQVP
jgi:hypothetical protein